MDLKSKKHKQINTCKHSTAIRRKMEFHGILWRCALHIRSTYLRPYQISGNRETLVLDRVLQIFEYFL